MFLIPALGRQRQVDVCQFKASLVYIMSSRTAKATHRDKPCQEENQTKTKEHNTPWKSIVILMA